MRIYVLLIICYILIFILLLYLHLINSVFEITTVDVNSTTVPMTTTNQQNITTGNIIFINIKYYYTVILLNNLNN